jgi:hypothetical protein
MGNRKLRMALGEPYVFSISPKGKNIIAQGNALGQSIAKHMRYPVRVRYVTLSGFWWV